MTPSMISIHSITERLTTFTAKRLPESFSDPTQWPSKNHATRIGGHSPSSNLISFPFACLWSSIIS
jgi:hypothetical protein